MNKYQVVVLRKLKGFGQFVTESRDEVNTYEFGKNDERPVIFGEKLKAVERRTIMRKVRGVLNVNCYLKTSKKGSDSGISGLCMSCPACALFRGTYAPKKGGAGGDAPRNAIEMRRVYYTAAFPFTGGGIRDVTFNAVDERTGGGKQNLADWRRFSADRQSDPDPEVCRMGPVHLALVAPGVRLRHEGLPRAVGRALRA
jgi:hypothetical protein